MDDQNNLPKKLIWIRDPKNYRWIVPLLAFLVLMFFVKGCFSKPESSSSEFIIARDGLWYPLNFYGKEKNMVGFSDELLLKVSKAKKIKIRLVSAAPGELMNTLNNMPRIDGIMTSLAPSVQLNDRYLFSAPYYEMGTVLVVAENSPIKSLADMKGKYLGARRGSAVFYSLPNHPEATIFPYDSMIVMLDDITRNRIDGALINGLNAYNLTSAYYKGRLRITTGPLTNEGLRLVTHNEKKDKKLITAFNDALKEFKANGVYHKLLQKWDLLDLETSEANENSDIL